MSNARFANFQKKSQRTTTRKTVWGTEVAVKVGASVPKRVVPKEKKEEVPKKQPKSTAVTKKADPRLQPDGTHKLHCSFSFWHLKKTLREKTDYTKNLKMFATVHTVEGFWGVYSHTNRPDNIPACDMHFFRAGIKPLWEDEANKNGGKWVVRLKKIMSARCWENTLLALVGDAFGMGDEICGAVLSSKFQEDLVSIWNKTAHDPVITARIRETIKRILNIPTNYALEYKAHDAAIEHISLKRNHRGHKGNLSGNQHVRGRAFSGSRR